jgi:uncharacterized membrane protein YfcA
MYAVMDGSVVTSVGLFARAQAAVQALGHEVRFVDATPLPHREGAYELDWARVHRHYRPHLPEDPFRPGHFRPAQEGCIQAVVNSIGGVIDAAPGVGKSTIIAAIAALIIGFYDGLIGPGTGSFLVLTLVAILGFAFLSASAIAKVVNVATNLGAIVIFGANGEILWKIGLTLAIANVAGGLIGAHLALKGGSNLVRKVFMGVTLALIIKVALDTFAAIN